MPEAGIGRLTSDIGLRPNARCPAREREGDGERPGEPVGPGKEDFRGAAHAARNVRRLRELVQGSLLFFFLRKEEKKKGFWKT